MSKKEIVETENLTITSPSIYEVTIKGMDSILFNRMADLSIPAPKKTKQSKTDKAEDELKSWREKTYFDDDGMLYIPGENIHESMKEGAQYWGQRIPGEGKKTYTDVVASAIICENLWLGIHKDSERLIPFGKACNANPSKGKKSGAKVYKIRPLLRPWGGTFKMHVFDARLSLPVLRTIIAYAGAYRGLCDWRPVYGRYEVVKIERLEI